MNKYIRHWTRDMIQNTIEDGTFLDYIITDDTHLNKHTHNTESFIMRLKSKTIK